MYILLDQSKSHASHTNQNHTIFIITWPREWRESTPSAHAVSLSVPMQGECDRFALTVGHLERTRCQMEAHTQELEKQQIEEAEKCHRLKVPTIPHACHVATRTVIS